MKAITDVRDCMAYKFAVITLEDEISKSTPVTEALITEVVDDSIKNSMVKDESASYHDEIIKELLEKKYAPLVKKNSLPIGFTLAEKDHADWKINKNFYWQQLHFPFISDRYASKDPTNWPSIVGSIDNESDTILSLMENPDRDKFDSKGLVIGYVQSGKTANFTALISKALDSGYKLILVLGGMHDSLRIQTQNRLNYEILGFDDLILDPANPEPSIKVNYEQGGYIDRRPERQTTSRYQQVGTTRVQMEAKGDFKQNKLLQDLLYPIEQYKSCVAVVKKNSKILERVLNWIEQCPENIREQIPLLIIDDEADQASVDANYIRNKNKLIRKNKSLKINKALLNNEATRINKLIKGIIDSFKKSAYVGYTATPFANVFIDSDGAYSNLYPHSFIHILPKPDEYFGAHEIFGKQEFLDAYVITDGVEDKKDANELLESKGFPPSLHDSIISFLICMAIRLKRGEENKAMSMLIHINHKNTQQDLVFKAVNDKIEHYKKIINYKSTQGLKLRNDISRLYKEIKSKGTVINKSRGVKGRKFFTESQVLDLICEILKKDIIKLKKVNGESDDELDYDLFPSMKVIAIGGNKLSRGLTLEGLMVSYFLRDSNNADTLMQMGRFFGYRSGYNDLMKIYTTIQLVSDFSELIECENLLRSEVERYVDEGKTPKDFAPAVIEFASMKPSGKMGNAVLNRRAFGLSESQTFKFKLGDTKLLKANMNAAVSFVNDLLESQKLKLEKPKFKSENKLFRNVPKSLIISFLEKIDVGDINLNQEALIEYIKGKDISTFNVGIPNNTKKGAVIRPFGKLGNFGLVDRSRRSDEIDGYYDIGSLSSPGDKIMDLEDKSQHYLADRKEPLILLYRINKDSKKLTSGSVRRDLFDGLTKKEDVLGLCILMPSASFSGRNYWVNRIEN
jgi:hypothetical protein